MTSTTALMADYFSGLDLADAPDRVVHEAKRFVLDTLGCLLAACDSEIAPIIRDIATVFGDGNVANIAGMPRPTSLFAAIYANGRLANALDFDETFPVGAHFGVGAVATALAFAQAYKLSGREFLTSVLAGYEFGGRVASYIGPVVQIDAGRVTGFPDVWGVAAPVVMAAAAASARARHFDSSKFAETIGLAGSNAPLPAGAQWSGAVNLPNCKYCDAGWCSLTGAFATLSAERGSTGFSTILDGQSGLARMYGVEAANERWLIEGLGTTWMLDDVTYKPWPTCRFTHYALTALETILAEHSIAPAEIEEIVIETGPLAASERFTNPQPTTFAAREFSYPHMVAMRIMGIPPGPRWLDADMVDHPEAHRLKKKMRIEQHPRAANFARTFTRNQIRTMPGGIRLTAAGKTYRAESDYALGDPWDEHTRFSDEDIFTKLRGLIGPKKADRLAEAVMHIEQSPNINSLVVLLTADMKEPAYV